MRLACALVAALLLASCSSSSPTPKAQLLHQMHQLVPNVPSDLIAADADEICQHAGPAARRNLLDDSMAAEAGVDGLDVGSRALRQYVARLIDVARDVNYC